MCLYTYYIKWLETTMNIMSFHLFDINLLHLYPQIVSEINIFKWSITCVTDPVKCTWHEWLSKWTQNRLDLINEHAFISITSPDQHRLCVVPASSVMYGFQIQNAFICVVAHPAGSTSIERFLDYWGLILHAALQMTVRVMRARRGVCVVCVWCVSCLMLTGAPPGDGGL